MSIIRSFFNTFKNRISKYVEDDEYCAVTGKHKDTFCIKQTFQI